MDRNDKGSDHDRDRDIIEAWILGRIALSDGALSGTAAHKPFITTLGFGQFSRADEPPDTGWIFLGRNIKVDTFGRRGSGEDGGNVARVLRDNPVPDDGLLAARNDRIAVSSIPTDDCIQTNPFAVKKIFNVSGCSIQEINGRYIEQGGSLAGKFKNVRNWFIFRVSLFEIPELGIYKSNCYDAAAGTLVNTLLDNRAGGILANLPLVCVSVSVLK
jgi:hypothetical protein